MMSAKYIFSYVVLPILPELKIYNIVLKEENNPSYTCHLSLRRRKDPNTVKILNNNFQLSPWKL